MIPPDSRNIVPRPLVKRCIHSMYPLLYTVLICTMVVDRGILESKKRVARRLRHRIVRGTTNTRASFYPSRIVVFIARQGLNRLVFETAGEPHAYLCHYQRPARAAPKRSIASVGEINTFDTRAAFHVSCTVSYHATISKWQTSTTIRVAF